ncbi:MAG: hypothetical protein Tsb0014_21170 [Pleurocapsa sp.]
MNYYSFDDLGACLAVQPKRKSPPIGEKAKQLAEELLILVNGNSDQAKTIVSEILYYNPNKPVEWYYEEAINRLNKSATNLVRI